MSSSTVVQMQPLLSPLPVILNIAAGSAQVPSIAPDQCNGLIQITGAQTGAGTITLPNPALCPGAQLTIVYTNTAAALGVIMKVTDAAGTHFTGIVALSGGTTGSPSAASVSFTATAVAGDSIRLVSDGVSSWCFIATSGVAAGVSSP
jgi:hypothetical protein